MKTTQKFLTAACIATFIAVVLAAANSTKKSATVTTNKSDYAPGDTVTIMGSGFAPNESVSLRIVDSNKNKPWDSFATPDALGNFSNSQFAVQKDFGVNFSLTATGLSSDVTATTTFTSSGQAAPSSSTQAAGDLSQYRNGGVGCNSGPCVACSPAAVAGWVNGNAGASNSHYVEGQSIPYREVMTNVPVGSVTIVMEYDTLHSSVHAIDYLTSFQRINEPVNPLDGLNGQGNNPPAPVGGSSTFAIPAPANDTAHGSPINCPTPPPFSGNGANQPTTSFANLAAASTGCPNFGGTENMTIYGGTITAITYDGALDGSLPNYQNVTSGNGQASTRLRITFTSNGGTVVLAWGGHIASRFDWGCPTAPQSAGGISGSPYHMRQITWSLNNLGNEDRSLSANAVVPPCPICLSDTISGGASFCPNSGVTTFTANNPDSTLCTSPTFTWAILNNTSGASFSSGNTGSSVQVNPGASCGSFDLQVTIGCQTCTGGPIVCSKHVGVVDSSPPMITATGTPSDGMLGCNPSAAQIDAALGTAMATDNCGPVTLNVSTASPVFTGCNASQTRTWTATDACSNTASTSRAATWTVDMTPPNLTVPAGRDLGCNPSTLPSDSDVAGQSSATDNCGGTPTITATHSDSTSGCMTTRTFSVTATDACGNMSSPAKTVVYTWTVDTAAPTITLSSGNCGDTVNKICTTTPPTFPTATANDNCNGDLGQPQNLTGQPIPTTRPLFYFVDTNPQPNTFVRTWHAIDSCGGAGSGNESICSYTIICQPCQPISACTPPYPCTTGCPAGTFNPSRTNIAFSESEVLRAFQASVVASCTPNQIQVFYNDEHALTLGVNKVSVKTKTGTTTTNCDVTPLPSPYPAGATNPSVGTTAVPSSPTGDATCSQNDVDVSGRPIYPVLFVTDVTDPSANPFAGDWQYGGTGIPPDAVFGTWKAAAVLTDMTKTPNVTTVTPAADPSVKNNWNLDGGDPAPAGLVNQGYGAEVRWDVSGLSTTTPDHTPLQPGHKYRLYVMVHDGDQNKAGGDSGQACVFLTMPSSP
jgi:hypothetical protein